MVIKLCREAQSTLRAYDRRLKSQQGNRDVLFQLKLKGKVGSGQSGAGRQVWVHQGEEQPLEQPRIRGSKEM